MIGDTRQMLTYNRQGGGSSFALGDGASQVKHRFGSGSGRESLNVFGENRPCCPGSRRGAALRVDLRGIRGVGLLAMTIPRRHLSGRSVRVLASGVALGFSKTDDDTGTRRG